MLDDPDAWDRLSLGVSWRRDVLPGDPCAYCGAPPRSTVDHIEPKVSGGAIGSENMTAACRRCNGLKSEQLLLTFLLSKPALRRAREASRRRNRPTVLVDRELDVVIGASWRQGLAGIAYAGELLGERAQLRQAPNSEAAEIEALLMAMLDARETEHLTLVFGTNSQAPALATLSTSASSSTVKAAEQIRDLLDEMPGWELLRVHRAQTAQARRLARDELRPWAKGAIGLGAA
jgi:HNH endonuclease